jgi:hypothetical protein
MGMVSLKSYVAHILDLAMLAALVARVQGATG